MKVYGYEFSEKVLDEAFSCWDPAAGYSGLRSCLRRLVPYPSHAVSRAADRLLQKKRRSGIIAPVPGSRSWVKRDE